ncbi:Gfo/Idh/MocA family protein [Nocardioides bruguierae]|uniref:Gfo/Idh/MocA family oxidoreductase n=1 Tax=Nocardioides bruguierae TaxID=2945102 RepID=A0A9X2D3K2_9ACTN|nr:Gfo/Idh/MocA family oxidoreductase [Nocardioides bruguierae]MCM0618686.1 Gfo/Idh/MocA family oxidoreductase [Nocardioides bruguierae]
MRLGLIGLGRIGAFHAETLSNLDAVETLVVADAVPAATASVAEKFGAEPADSPEALIASGVDGVVIAAATAAHAPLLRAAVDAGIPAFCEKPLSAVLADAVSVAQHVEDSGVAVQVGYPRRFDPAYLAAYDARVAGDLGWVHTVRSTTLDPAPAPRGYIETSGGIFRDCSVHDFDTVRWITGQEPVEVYATGHAHGDPMFAEFGDVATAQTLITFADGSTGVVSNTRYNPRGYDVRLEVHGTGDSVAAGWSDQAPLRNLEPGSTWPSAQPWGFFMDRLTDAFRAELTAFTELVSGARTESPCTVQDALAVAWMAEAADLSLKEHRPVTIDEVK